MNIGLAEAVNDNMDPRLETMISRVEFATENDAEAICTCYSDELISDEGVFTGKEQNKVFQNLSPDYIRKFLNRKNSTPMVIRDIDDPKKIIAFFLVHHLEDDSQPPIGCQGILENAFGKFDPRKLARANEIDEVETYLNANNLYQIVEVSGKGSFILPAFLAVLEREIPRNSKMVAIVYDGAIIGSEHTSKTIKPESKGNRRGFALSERTLGLTQIGDTLGEEKPICVSPTLVKRGFPEAYPPNANKGELVELTAQPTFCVFSGSPDEFAKSMEDHPNLFGISNKEPANRTTWKRIAGIGLAITTGIALALSSWSLPRTGTSDISKDKTQISDSGDSSPKKIIEKEQMSDAKTILKNLFPNRNFEDFDQESYDKLDEGGEQAEYLKNTFRWITEEKSEKKICMFSGKNGEYCSLVIKGEMAYVRYAERYGEKEQYYSCVADFSKNPPTYDKYPLDAHSVIIKTRNGDKRSRANLELLERVNTDGELMSLLGTLATLLSDEELQKIVDQYAKLKSDFPGNTSYFESVLGPGNSEHKSLIGQADKYSRGEIRRAEGPTAIHNMI